MQRKWKRNWRKEALRRIYAGFLAGALLLGGYSTALAAPQGGAVAAGSATISQNGALTTVNQASQKAVINWNSFNIAKGETVRFNQPGASAIALNRVTGNNASAIYGTLSANGQVFLVNPNGVLFAKGAQVNVGGLAASTLGISDTNFLNGNYQFSGDSAKSVVNQGELSAAKGYIAILGANVANEGVIVAKEGTAALGAGSKVNLDFSGDGLLQMSVDKEAVAALASNKGLIQADGGLVVMSAKSADALAGTVVNNSGVIEAKSVSTKNGVIRLEGGNSGSVINSGILNASGLEAGQSGGTVKVLGDKVSLTETSVLNASGDAAGGTILVGGNYQGSGTEQRATETNVAAGASLKADAVNSGNGGTVVVWADKTTTFGGTISAKGGRLSGDGGKVETSGKQKLTVADTAKVDTIAAKGKTGSWLLDPNDFTVDNTGTNGMKASTLQTALGLADVTITTTSGDASASGATAEAAAGGTGNGDINILADVNWSANKLTLSAYRNINIKANLFATGTSSLDMTSGTKGTIGVDGVIDYGLTASGFTGKVNFATRFGNNFLKINGTSYTVITGLGAAGSTTKTDLQGMNGNLNGHYFLGADIDASSTSTWNSNAGFTPIGDKSNPFAGVFDGGGHAITGLSINRPTVDYVGLFGQTYSAMLRNLSIVNASIIGGEYYVGSLAGEATNGTQITKCSATGSIKGERFIGGLVGANSGSISSSYATGSASGNSSIGSVGGLVGSNSGSISSSYATGTVSGYMNVGGLAGSSSGSISNSYAAGSVAVNSSGGAAGGLVGSISGSDSENISSISSSYATGRVTGNRVGGLVGSRKLYSSITNSYWDKDTSGQATDARAKSTSELMSALPTGFDSSVWGIIPGTSYPYLKWNCPTTPQVVSGFVKDAAGATQVGQTVQTMANGSLKASATSGANGFYYMLLDNNSIANAKSVLSFAGTQGGTATVTTAANQSLTGFDITTGRVTVTQDGGINVTALLGQAKGDNTVSAPYTVSGNNISVNGDLYVSASGSVQAIGALTVSGATTVTASSGEMKYDIYMNSTNNFSGPVTLTGQNVTLNNSGALTLGAVTAPGSFTLTAGGNITANGAVSTGLFALQGGNWQQVNSVLPTFSATDFRISGGSFLRAQGGTGVSGDSYQITDVYGLQGMGSAGMLGRHYTLANDIDASGTSKWNNNGSGVYAGFVPIGNNSNTQFTGTFDGGGHTVSGLTINSSSDFVGLFGHTNGGALLSNIGLINASVIGTYSGGGSNYSGGLVGKNLGTIMNSYASGSVTGTGVSSSPYVGGLVGDNLGTIENSYASSSVTGGGSSSDGGLVGYNLGTIKNSYATGSVTGTGRYSDIGGLAGDSSGAITNSYATGSVTGTGTIGGLLGKYYGGAITNSYWDTLLSGISDLSKGVGNVSSAAGVTGLTTAQMKETAHYNTWDTTSVWYLNGGYTAPLLRAFLTPLTVSAESQSKVYDGNSTADIVNETRTPSTGTYDASKVGGILAWSGKDVVVGGHGLTGLYTTSQQGYLISYDSNAKLTITARPLTATASVEDKVYDGTTAATISGVINLNNLVGSDMISATYSSGTFADKNVGNNKTVTLSGITLSGTDAGNYSLVANSITSSASITPATLIITATSNTKTYDGNVSATATPTVSSGSIYDVYTLSEKYDDKNVGSGKVLIPEITFATASDAANYAITAVNANTGIINKASLTAGLVGTVQRVYDGNTTATLSGANYSLSGFVNGETANVSGTASYDDKNVGTGKTVTVSGLTLSGANAANYTVNDTASSAIGVITTRPLTATVSAANKVYDGTTSATISGGITLGNFIAGDAVSATYTSGVFVDKNVGNNKTVTLSGITLSGSDAANYSLAANSITSSASITKAPLTITATSNTKIYDGNVSATATPTVSSGSVYDVYTLSEKYDDKNVGSGKVLTPEIAFATASDAANYAITAVNANTGIINKASLTASLSGTVEKIYNGNTSATLQSSNGALAGVIGSDVVTISGSGSYDTKDVGSGKTVTITSVNLVGADAGNYELSSSTGSVNGTITKAPLTLVANDARKTYDKLPYSGGNGVSGSGFAAGEGLGDLAGTLAYGGNSQGAVEVGKYGISVSGLTSSNYDITFRNGTLTVNKAAMSDPAYNGAVQNSQQSGATGPQERSGSTPGGAPTTNLRYTDGSTGRTLSVSGAEVTIGGGLVQVNMGAANSDVAVYTPGGQRTVYRFDAAHSVLSLREESHATGAAPVTVAGVGESAPFELLDAAGHIARFVLEYYGSGATVTAQNEAARGMLNQPQLLTAAALAAGQDQLGLEAEEMKELLLR